MCFTCPYHMSFYRSNGILKFIDKGKIVTNINISITQQLLPSFLGDTLIQLGLIYKKRWGVVNIDRLTP